MIQAGQEEKIYRVLLKSIGENSEQERDDFCKRVSESFGISFSLLRRIVDRSPIVLKKNLPLKKAETLAKTLQLFGAKVTVEEKRSLPEILLEFQDMAPYQVALEASTLRRTLTGAWNVMGRVKNISKEDLQDVWVLIQLFDDLEEFITFEEAPLSINPLPPGEVSPFKVILEGDLPVKKASIAFKNASGHPFPTLDQRKKREWIEVEMEEAGQSFQFAPWSRDDRTSEPLPPRVSLPTSGLTEDIGVEGQTDKSLEQDLSTFCSEEGQREEERSAEGSLGEPLYSQIASMETDVDSPEKNIDLSWLHLGDDQDQEEKREAAMTEGEGIAPEEDEITSLPQQPLKEVRVDAVAMEEASQLLEEISKREEPVETVQESEKEEEPFSFPWVDSFREAIEDGCRRSRDLFSNWFEETRKERGLSDPFQSLLVIVVNARFNQSGESEKALENTKRVWGLLSEPDLLLEDIPPLEGTRFHGEEVWRDLFYRAMPKVKQGAMSILSKKNWEATELERVIQIIPHMSPPNSRLATRWISELVPETAEVDFSNRPVTVEERIYRVAARLGIVDPHFDFYEGSGSMGDLRIQSFARLAFPQFPSKIEEPMVRIGSRDEEGGHCFPLQPRCEGCLFEPFCPKLFLHFNPSEKGMRSKA